MTSYELIVHTFQVITLFIAAVLAQSLYFHGKKIRFAIYSCACTSFALGTLYYTLYLAITGHTPTVFYASEISWIASYLFLISLQIVRTEAKKEKPAMVPLLFGAITFAASISFGLFGPSRIFSCSFGTLAGILICQSLMHLQRSGRILLTDVLLILLVVLQHAVYIISGFTEDYARFNLCYAADILLTLTFCGILPSMAAEVRNKRSEGGKSDRRQ